MSISFYNILWIFFIYAFIGWCTEVAYAALNTGKFVNRGFLNGPLCPIYGTGILVVSTVLTPVKENLLFLFFGSMVLTTIIEFLTGFLLEKLFHCTWWDYSTEHFNICGYVCLKFSILWGMACTFIMDIIHPMVQKMIRVLPKIPGTVVLILMSIYFITDCIITVAGILKLNNRLKLMEDIASRLREISDDIGENIYETIAEAVEKKEKLEQSTELRQKLKELVSQKKIVQNRLLKAFPGMKSKRYQEMLDKLKQHIENK